MSHFGIICPPVSSHITCTAALGRELQRRGHRVTLFGIPDVEAKARSEDINYWAIGQSDHPLGSLASYLEQMGKLNGLSGLRFGIQTARKEALSICRDAPKALKEAGVEALLVDQGEPAGGTVAEYLEIPFVTVCCAVPFNREVYVPPYNLPWDYQTTWWATLRNSIGYSLFDWFTKPIAKVVAQYRQQWKLPAHRTFDDSFSKLAQISQQTAEFDFPRRALPNCFHYIGLFRNSSPQAVPFPYEQLSDRPLIYVSLGTMQNLLPEVFHCIASACEGVDAQLVISLGGGGDVEQYKTLPGQPLVVKYAPQLELLARAALTINHAGINTVLEALSYGVPQVAIPITNDQPGTGARIKWTGVGEVLPLKRLSESRLRETVERVLREDSYRSNAQRLQASLSRAGGAAKAADIIEQAIATGTVVR